MSTEIELVVNSESKWLEEYLNTKEAYITDKEFMRYTSHARTQIDLNKYIENSKKYIQKGINNKNNLMFIVVEHSNPLGIWLEHKVGEINLQNIDWINRSAELTFMIWEKRHAVEAGKQVLEHAFNRLNLNKVWLGTPAIHTAMIEVAQKIGMTGDSVLEQEFYLDGKYYNVIRFKILAEDYYNE